jgi:hypothetical protein
MSVSLCLEKSSANIHPEYDNANSFADNDMIHQSCFRMETGTI